MRSPSAAQHTGNRVQRDNTPTSRLGWSGLRCSTTATGAGNEAGNPLSTADTAARPPADAPITTTSKAGIPTPGVLTAGVSFGGRLSEEGTAHLTPFRPTPARRCTSRTAGFGPSAYDSAVTPLSRVSVSSNVEPCPGSLLTVTSPSIALARLRLIARPRPIPSGDVPAPRS